MAPGACGDLDLVSEFGTLCASQIGWPEPFYMI